MILLNTYDCGSLKREGKLRGKNLTYLFFFHGYSGKNDNKIRHLYLFIFNVNEQQEAIQIKNERGIEHMTYELWF